VHLISSVNYHEKKALREQILQICGEGSIANLAFGRFDYHHLNLDVWVLTDGNLHFYAIATYDLTFSPEINQSVIHIYEFAAIGKNMGYGREMMEQIKNYASEKGYNIILEATPFSRTFYEKMGFKYLTTDNDELCMYFEA
jgi:GNAT superfamily N-acetyltransferase